MKNSDINIRDPFILADDGKYYLYGSRGPEAWGKCTGLDVYVSSDLEEWSAPTQVFTPPADFWADRNFWAPEVHKYKDSYYMFVSFYSDTQERGTQILKANSPTGPFLLHSDGPVTPRSWSCLDGTLYVEDGVPYIVFCHEWTQVYDGEMCCMQLSDDLKETVGEPRILFKASQTSWASAKTESEPLKDGFVTDGPYLYKTKSGRLLMIWSSFDNKGYVEAVAYSSNGKISGEWKHCVKLLSAENGGHGMIFKDFSNQLYFTMHSPNNPSTAERVKLFKIEEIEEEPYFKFI